MNEEYFRVNDTTVRWMKNLAGSPGMLENMAATDLKKSEPRTENYAATPELYLG